MTSRSSRTTPNPHDNRDKGTLASVNMDGNDIRCSGIKAMAAALKTSSISSLSVANCRITVMDDESAYTMEGVIEFSEAINANGALSKLGIQHNGIDEARKAKIQQICDSKSIICLL